ncbi:MAG TPA: FIST N-terminal domain-containing protein [Solirubrobacteraceae bacterium]|nr:FIST N-terminal domain-containing protein [Solirubrobacteraceae bacterium]
MSVRIGAGLTTGTDPSGVDPRVAAVAAGAEAGAALGGAGCDLAVVFVAGAHLAAPEAVLEGVVEALDPEVLIGCGAGGVLARGREVEDGTAVSVWAASLDGGAAHPFHAVARPVDDGVLIEGLPDFEGADGALLLPDPYTFPTDAILRDLALRAPGVPLLGGLSSARTLDGEGALFLGDEVVDSGAVGVRLEGVELLPCVSQGAAPVGPEITVTSADGHVIAELAGQPALVKIREIVDALPERERGLIGGGLLLGLVIDGGKPEYERGDFLVRTLLGADPDAGTIAVGVPVSEGQVIRLHARDAVSADDDLREALELRRRALGDRPPAGSLVFTCNGRGSGMFGVTDHDAEALDRQLEHAPAAGFFAAGEIGPVGGESFLHGFTATVAIFPG